MVSSKPTLRQRLSSIVTAAILAVVLWKLIDQLMIMILVPMPWWALVLIIVVLFLIIEHLVSQAFAP